MESGYKMHLQVDSNETDRLSRILISFHQLRRPGGAGTWVQAFANELRKRSYIVDVLSIYRGEMSRRIGGTINKADLLERGVSYYDVAFTNDNRTLRTVLNTRCSKHVVMTSHGVSQKADEFCEGANQYLSVSEEVARKAKNLGFTTTIIRNGVDFNSFVQLSSLSEELSCVGLLSKSLSSVDIVQSACDIVGCRFRPIGCYSLIDNVSQEINQCDLIVTVGRGVLEAAACGRPVVVFDNRDYMECIMDGYLKRNNAVESMTFNYSGRAFAIPATPESLAFEIKKYRVEDGVFIKKHCLMHHDIVDITNQYLSHCGR